MRKLVIAVCVISLSVIALSNQKDVSSHTNKLGVTVKAPSKDGWKFKKVKENLYFQKEGLNSTTHTFFTSVVQFMPKGKFESKESFLQYAEIGKNRMTPLGRYMNLTVDCKLEKRYGEYCVKYTMSCEDHQAKGMADGEFLIMNTVGYVCMHPFYRNIAIDINYSERFKQGEESSRLRAEGELFIKSLFVERPNKK